MNTDKLFKDLGINLEDLETVQPKSNMLPLPFSTFMNMYQDKALRIHLNNLIATYGKEAVVNILIEIIKV